MRAIATAMIAICILLGMAPSSLACPFCRSGRYQSHYGSGNGFPASGGGSEGQGRGGLTREQVEAQRAFETRAAEADRSIIKAQTALELAGIVFGALGQQNPSFKPFADQFRPDNDAIAALRQDIKTQNEKSEKQMMLINESLQRIADNLKAINSRLPKTDIPAAAPGSDTPPAPGDGTTDSTTLDEKLLELETRLNKTLDEKFEKLALELKNESNSPPAQPAPVQPPPATDGASLQP